MKSTVFKQVTQVISNDLFQKISKKYNGDRYTKTFSSWNHLMLMIYVQLTGKISLRDIIHSLESKSEKLYHMGFGMISRNNLSHQNARRDYRIFQDVYYTLKIKFSATLAASKKHKFRFKKELKSIDSTTISLCKSLYGWAGFRETKSGIKLHTILDHKSQLPDFIVTSNASCNDAKGVKELQIRENSIYVLDRAYLCLKWLYSVVSCGSHFVIRLKSNTKYKVLSRRKISAHLRRKGIVTDHEIRFTGSKKDDYPETLRKVKYRDLATGEVYEYITDNFELSPFTIAEIYRDRWSIELFFKKIKQNLKIKRFIGLSENAVLIQVWTAMIVVLLFEWNKFLSAVSMGLREFLSRVQPNIFTGRRLFDVLKPPDSKIKSNAKRVDFQQGLLY